MSERAQRLDEVDRELAAFGKSDEELAEVVTRAVATARALADTEGELGALQQGAGEALARARSAAREAVAAAVAEAAPARPLPKVAPRPVPARPAAGAERRPAAPDAKAPASPPSEPPPSAPPPSAPRLAHRATSKAPVQASEPEALDARIDEAFGSEPPPYEGSDIAGMSVDELFADADPTPSEAPGEDLASLFDDGDADAPDEALRLSDPDLGLESLEDAAEPSASAPRSAAPPPPPPSAVPPPPPTSEPPQLEDFPAFGQEEAATQIMSAEQVEALGDDDFELLVDEEVLEMDEPEETESEGEGGLISRILGRK